MYDYPLVDNISGCMCSITKSRGGRDLTSDGADPIRQLQQGIVTSAHTRVGRRVYLPPCIDKLYGASCDTFKHRVNCWLASARGCLSHELQCPFIAEDSVVRMIKPLFPSMLAGLFCAVLFTFVQKPMTCRRCMRRRKHLPSVVPHELDETSKYFTLYFGAVLCFIKETVLSIMAFILVRFHVFVII